MLTDYFNMEHMKNAYVERFTLLLRLIKASGKLENAIVNAPKPLKS